MVQFGVLITVELLKKKVINFPFPHRHYSLVMPKGCK